MRGYAAHEPALVERWQKGDTREALCIHCNKCIPTSYSGTHCVLIAPAERPGRARAASSTM